MDYLELLIKFIFFTLHIVSFIVIMDVVFKWVSGKGESHTEKPENEL